MSATGAYRCPKCKAPTRVVETRQTGRAEVQRRRRECLNNDCAVRFTTFEMPESMLLEFQSTVSAMDTFKEALRKINEVNGHVISSVLKGEEK